MWDRTSTAIGPGGPSHRVQHAPTAIVPDLAFLASFSLLPGQLYSTP